MKGKRYIAWTRDNDFEWLNATDYISARQEFKDNENILEVYGVSEDGEKYWLVARRKLR